MSLQKQQSPLKEATAVSSPRAADMLVEFEAVEENNFHMQTVLLASQVIKNLDSISDNELKRCVSPRVRRYSSVVMSGTSALYPSTFFSTAGGFMLSSSVKSATSTWLGAQSDTPSSRSGNAAESPSGVHHGPITSDSLPLLDRLMETSGSAFPTSADVAEFVQTVAEMHSSCGAAGTLFGGPMGTHCDVDDYHVKLASASAVSALVSRVTDMVAKTSRTALAHLTVPVNGRLVICGDTHGQLDDVLWVFFRHGMPRKSNVYLFNGDIADRGSHALEIFLILLMFKLQTFESVHMIRGNHEDDYCNIFYGFLNELKHKFGHVEGGLLHQDFLRLFYSLPLACLVDNWHGIYRCALTGALIEIAPPQPKGEGKSKDKDPSGKSASGETKEGKSPSQTDPSGSAQQSGETFTPGQVTLRRKDTVSGHTAYIDVKGGGTSLTFEKRRAVRSLNSDCAAVVTWGPGDFWEQVSPRLLVVHGGLPLPPNMVNSPPTAAQQSVALRHFCELPHRMKIPADPSTVLEQWMYQLLWSDPREINGPKGRGTPFLAHHTASFCELNNVHSVIRSHQVPVGQRGVSFHHNNRLLTVFTASNYCGTSNNLGAVIVLTPETFPNLVPGKTVFEHWCPGSQSVADALKKYVNASPEVRNYIAAQVERTVRPAGIPIPVSSPVGRDQGVGGSAAAVGAGGGVLSPGGGALKPSQLAGSKTSPGGKDSHGQYDLEGLVPHGDAAAAHRNASEARLHEKLADYVRTLLVQHRYDIIASVVDKIAQGQVSQIVAGQHGGTSHSASSPERLVCGSSLVTPCSTAVLEKSVSGSLPWQSLVGSLFGQKSPKPPTGTSPMGRVPSLSEDMWNYADLTKFMPSCSDHQVNAALLHGLVSDLLVNDVCISSIATRVLARTSRPSRSEIQAALSSHVVTPADTRKCSLVFAGDRISLIDLPKVELDVFLSMAADLQLTLEQSVAALGHQMALSPGSSAGNFATEASELRAIFDQVVIQSTRSNAISLAGTEFADSLSPSSGSQAGQWRFTTLSDFFMTFVSGDATGGVPTLMEQDEQPGADVPMSGPGASGTGSVSGQLIVQREAGAAKLAKSINFLVAASGRSRDISPDLVARAVSRAVNAAVPKSDGYLSYMRFCVMMGSCVFRDSAHQLKAVTMASEMVAYGLCSLYYHRDVLRCACCHLDTTRCGELARTLLGRVLASTNACVPKKWRLSASQISALAHALPASGSADSGSSASGQDLSAGPVMGGGSSSDSTVPNEVRMTDEATDGQLDLTTPDDWVDYEKFFRSIAIVEQV